MSEFTYACPVCSQHIKCDSSQGGSIMECPTCFQKVIAPQAPSDPNSKFVLVGQKYQKYGEKKTTVASGAEGIKTPGSGIRTPPIASRLPGDARAGQLAAPGKKFPVVIVLVMLLVLGGGAGVFVFKDKLFQSAPKFESMDIGSVGQAGSFSEKNGTCTITGAGGDIWDKVDAFHFAYEGINGDFTMTTRVEDVQNTHDWAKAGLMVRETLTPDSAYVILFVSPSQGIAFQKRSTAGSAATALQNVYNVKAPHWLRLTRQGYTVTAYESADGTQWKTVGSTTVVSSEHVYGGLVVCSHNYSVLCKATFDNVSVKGMIEQSASQAAAPAPGTPAPAKFVAPQASDSNWTMKPGGVEIPLSTAVGRIHGQNFAANRAYFGDGTLVLRAGASGPIELGVLINFEGASEATLSGQVINVNSDADKAARVTLRWSDGKTQTASFDNGYAMRLEFGAATKNRLPGRIYLCTPDDKKSYIMGTFNAEIKKPKAPKPKK